MRLINTETLQFKQFYNLDGVKYVVLSHRWRDEPDGEATLQQYQQFIASHQVYWSNGRDTYSVISSDESAVDIQKESSSVQPHPGIRKVLDFCEIGKRRNFVWAWIDTVCIDKTSSAELSEAINSMFKWYRGSECCFVHLKDFNSVQGITELKKSEWFSRGWTLQELLAPNTVLFFDRTWTFFASKVDLASVLEEATQIPSSAIKNLSAQDFSAAQRMSWAGDRVTTRAEDVAYCLLGLLGVNMELLYGEGAERAFERLQIRYMEEYEDETLLAWNFEFTSDDEKLLTKDNKPKPLSSYTFGVQFPIEGNGTLGKRGQKIIDMRCAFTGMLATSPAQFRKNGNFIPSKSYAAESPTTISNRGLQFDRGVSYLCTVKCGPYLKETGPSIMLPVVVVQLACRTVGTSYRYILLAQDVTSKPVERWFRLIPKDPEQEDLAAMVRTALKKGTTQRRIYARLSWPNYLLVALDGELDPKLFDRFLHRRR